MNLIFKIVSASDWSAAQATGVFGGAAVDRADGYIHFSTAAQAPETARKWFSGRDDLMLVAVDADALGARCVGSPRAAAPFSRISMANCRWWRSSGRGRCRSGKTAGTVRNPLAMIGALGALARPSFSAAAGKRAPGCDRGVEVLASLAGHGARL